MFHSRFFRRLYLTYALLVVITAGAIGLLIERQVRGDMREQIGLRLRATAAAMRSVAERAFTDPTFAADAIVGEVGADTGIRVTLIAPDGRVLADSERDPAQMESHGARPEVLAAMREGSGTSTRHSTTLRMQMLYHARRLGERERPLGTIRVAIPLAEVDEELRQIRLQVLQGAIIAVLLALALGVIVARRFTVPVTEMTEVSDALRRGDYDRRVTVTGGDELHLLGDNLNRLADELRERMASLTHQRAQLDTIIRSMQEGLVAIDEERRVIVSNRVGRELLGLGGAAEPALTAAEITDVSGLDGLLAEIEGGAGTARREIVVRRDEAEVVLDARAARFETDVDRGVVIVLYDISDLRRLERVRTDFVANVSHELKTPLTSIQGYVETLLDGAVDDPDNNVRFLGKIQEHVRRLSALVSDLLSLARIEAPAQPARLTPVDWREIVIESLERRRDPAGAKSLTLTVEPADEPVRVQGEPESMRQIVDNLLDNAIAYTPAGGSITVRVHRRGDAGVVEVTDTGIGIPENAVARVFERFYRVERGRTREPGGTGLGLSIVRNLVARMGGRVGVESHVGVGSTFTVELPAAD